MISWILAAGVALAASQAPDPAQEAYDAEASRIASRWPTEERCLNMPRLPGESVEACIERRHTAMAASGMTLHQVPPTTAGPARKRCDDGELHAGEPLGACMSRMIAEAYAAYDIFGDSNSLSAAFSTSPASSPPPPRPVTCRREATHSEDGTSASATVICGNGDHDAAAAMLDSLLRPND